MDFGTIIKITQFVLCLSLLIILHELGHFLPAKWFKTRVDKFYLFFDPYFSLIKKKIGETEYGIGWLPLGGYVKIAGMVDESMDTEQMKKDPEPWEFRSKPAWQRLIIMAGGVTVNFILAWLIYSIMSMTYGVETIDNSKLKYGIKVDEYSKAMGFEDGDRIISIDENVIDDMKDLTLEFIKGENAIVERNGEKVVIAIDQNAQKDFTTKLKNKEISPISFRIPISPIDNISKGSLADKAGLIKGDQLLRINNKPIVYLSDIALSLNENQGKSIEVIYARKGKEENVTISLPDTKTLLGIEVVDKKYLESIINYKTNSFLESIPYGFNKTISTITGQISGLKILGKEGGWKNLSGPIGIAKAFPTEWDWQFFWNFTAMLSAWLAFLNLLPIPALDGGHIVFTLYEMISGRKPSQKVLEIAQMIGFIIMMGLFILIFGVDLFNMF